MKRLGGKPLSKECPFCDLRGVDFENRDLTNANLSGADLTGANLTNAKLNGAVLLRANLTDAVLTDASLDSSPGHTTNLTGANITRLRFRIIDLDTFPAATGFADLRPRTSTTATSIPSSDVPLITPAILIAASAPSAIRRAVAALQLAAIHPG